jgi:hypothetical protein
MLCCAGGLFLRLPAAAQPQSLFSQQTAALFVEQAAEIYRADPLDAVRLEQAMTFLEAARSLDSVSPQIPEHCLRIGSGNCYGDTDYTQVLRWALDYYLDERADLETATGAVRCMLERLQARVDREALLDKLYRKYTSKNPAFASDVATQLGLLAAEKSDTAAALDYLSAAYDMNPYNQLAFDAMVELSAARNMTPTPTAQLSYLRAMVDKNPYDLAAAVQYADALRRMQLYDAASGAYAYAVGVFEFLYPAKPLDAALVINWIVSCYHVQRMENQCLEIADKYRDPSRFDLMLEALAGKAMIRLGQGQKGRQLLESAGETAETMLAGEDAAVPIYPEHLAWFYAFVLEQPEKALAWSNRAFQEAPQRQGVAAVFGYTLAVSGQPDLARQYAEPLKETDQIAAMTMALVERAQDPNQSGLETLRAVVEMAPDSFAAEKAVRLLKDRGLDYIPSLPVETIRKEIEQEYGPRVIPAFVLPSNRCTAKLLFNGSDFQYGMEISSRLVIENISADPLIIAEGGCLNGEIRVGAVLSGDLNVEIPNLLSTRFRPSRPVGPAEHISIPLDLETGKLRKLLTTYPQANVRIQFVLYLDPVLAGDGKVQNRLKGIEPVQAQIQRSGIVLSRDFVMQRLEVLTRGQPGQKLQAASLFTGLLAERKAFESSQADFKHMQTEQVLLVDAVVKLLTDEDWKVRIQTMAGLLAGSVPLEYGLLNEVSNNLNHDQWPVRLMAMYLLAKNHQPGSFQKVLDWTAQYDAWPLNCRMAIALGAKKPRTAQADPNTP